ncbi:MAG: sigma factor, partial [Proteobacteria bacterium]|nr:sigma factor [Pseudomonadota bacterium]
MRATAKNKDIVKVWRRFKRSGDRLLRNTLMVNYLPIVKYNAERVSAKLPDEIESDDLVSAGVFGLMDAIEAFDLTRGVKFETYCAPRIRGAILDELRSMDWVPRLVRSRAHKLTRASVELQAFLGRMPNEAELAERLKMTRPEFAKLIREATAVSQVSLSRK